MAKLKELNANPNGLEFLSSDIPDWSRERPRKFWDPSRKLLRSIREYQRLRDGKFISGFARNLCVIRHRFWSVVTGADIPLNSQLGGGLLIPHPNGIVIHPQATIGVNCLIFQQVTIGTSNGGGLPVIEGNVDMGAGSKILGSVRIHAHARIGANTVVLSDVPPGASAVGNPARIILPNPSTE